MSYEIVLARSFKHSVRRLKKRFRNVQNDVKVAIRTLLEKPRLGTVVRGSSGVRKLRVRNTDLGKGKRGGYRLLYHVEDQPVPRIYLLLLYAKSDREDITKQELKQLLDELDEMGE